MTTPDIALTASAAQRVAAIAARWGFSNLGRFAAMYRGEFGETPSMTLRS